MSAQLGWQQKWSASGVTWDAAWSDGFSVGAATMAAGGRMTLAVSGWQIGVLKELGALSLAMTAGPTLAAQGLVPVTPTAKFLGDLRIDMRGLTTAAGAFDTVDPRWLDPPFIFPMTARMTFPGVVSIQQTVTKQLGALTLPMVARTAFAPATLGQTLSFSIGAATIAMTGGAGVSQAGFVARTGAPHNIGDATIALGGRSTLAGNPGAVRPAHPLGDVTLAMNGAMTTSVITLFSGGPFTIGSPSLNLFGRMAPKFGLSYPPFDQQLEMRSAVDPTVTAIKAEVEDDTVSSAT